MADSLELNANFKPVKDSIDSLIGGLSKLEKKLDEQVASVRKFEEVFSSTFKSLIGALKELEAASRRSSSFERLFGNSRDFELFVLSVNKLGQVPGNAFLQVARGLAAVADSVRQLNNPAAVDSFRSITTEIFELTYALSSQTLGLDSEKIRQFSTLSVVFKNIANVVKAVQSINTADLKNFSIPPETTESIKRLMAAIVEIDTGISRGTEKNVNILQTVFKGLTSAVFGQGNDNSRAVINTSESLLSFSRALKNINKTINEVDVKKTLAVFAQLGGGLQLFSAIIGRLPGQQEFADFSKIFQRLGIGISGLGRGVENLDFAGIKKLVAALGILSGAIKIITTVVKFNKNTEAFANVIGSVTKSLSTLAQLQTTNLKKQNIVNLDDIISAITKTVLAFSKLSGKKIPDLSATITSLKDFISSLSQDISNKALANIGKVVDKLVTALAKLNAVQVNTARLKAISTQLEAISRLQSLDKSVSSIERAASVFTAGAVVNGFVSFGKTILDLIVQIGLLEDKVAVAFQQIGRQFMDVGRQIQDVGETILRNAGFQQLFELEATKVAAEFDALSSSLKVFGGLTDEQLKSAQAFADQIGIKYPLSANEALKATLDLLKAGQDLSSVQFILPSAADLAALSDSGDLEGATRALIAAEGAFEEFADGVPATFENISKATDIIAAAADSSTASIEDISAGLADVGASAKTAGLNTEETAAALALLNDAQLRGAEGGRGLRAALNSIFTRDKAAEEFKKLGVAIFDVEGNIRNFDDILKDLNRRFQGLTQQQIVSSLGNISDTFGRTALSVLIANDGISDTVEQMRNVGSASERVSTLLDNFKGDLDQLRGSFETFQKRALLPTVQRYLRPVVQLFRQLVDAALALPDEVFELASTFLTLGSAIATLIGGTTVLVGLLTRLSGGFIFATATAFRAIFNLQAVAGIFGLMATSLGIVIPLIAAFTGGLLFLSDKVNTAFRLVRDNVGGAGDAFLRLRDTIQTLFGEIGRIVNSVVSVVRFTFDEIFNISDSEQASFLVNLFDQVGKGVENVVNFLKGIDTDSIIRFFITLKFEIRDFLDRINETIQQVSQRVGDFFGPIVDKIQLFAAEVRVTIDTIIDIFNGFGAEVEDFPLVDTLVNVANYLQNVFVSQIQEVINILQGFNQLVLVPIRDNVPKIVERIKLFVGIIANIFEPLAEFVVNQGKIIIDFFLKLPGALRDFTRLGSLVSDFVNNFIQGLGNLPKALGETITRIGVQLRSNFLVVLGKVFETGDIRPLIDAIARTFEKLITSIPDTLIRLGESTGNKYISGFGAALQSGSIAQVIDTFVDLVRDLIGQAGIRLIKIFSDVFNSIFASTADNIERSFIDTLLLIPNTIINVLAAPLQFAFQVLARGLDFASLGAEIIQGLAKAIIESFANLIPGLLATLAESTQSAALKTILGTLADVGKRVADALGSLLTLPLGLISSALQALSELIDFLDRVGLLKQAGFAAAVVGIIAFKDAIISLVTTAKLTFIQPTIIALQALLFQMRSFAAAAILQAKTALITFFTSLRGVLSQALLVALNAFNAGLATTGSQLVSLGRASFAGIIAGLRGIGTAARSVIATLQPIILVTAAIVALKAAFDGLSDGFRNGALSGILTFFESISVSVLNILGLSDLVPQVQENFRMFEILVNHWAAQVQKRFQNVIDRIIVGFSQIRADLEQLAGGGDFSNQFLGTSERIKSIGQQTGIAFFEGLSDTLKKPEDLNSIRALLATSADKVLEAFDDAFTSKNFEQLKANPELARTIFETLDLAGAVPDALARLDINQLFDFRRLLSEADPELAGRTFGQFFEAAITKGLSRESFVDEEARRIFRDNIINNLEAGNITEDQAERFLEAIGFSSDAFAVAAGEISTRFEVLGQSFDELFAKAQESTLDDLRKQFEDGTISADEYRDALNKLGEEIVNTAEAIREDKVQALTRQFDEGLISEEEYRQGLRAINEEAEQFKINELEAAIAEIESQIQSGAISFQDGAKQIAELNRQLNILKGAPKDLTAELEKLEADFAAGKVEAKEFAEEYERITKAIEDAQKASNKGIESTVTVSDSTENTSVDVPVAEQEEYNELLKEEENIRKRIRDFQIDESRRLEDDLREEAKKRDEIEEIRREATEKENEAAQDFYIDRQRAEQDHQKKLLDIARSANKQFNDAIAARDASAAQSAVDQLEEQKRSENEQFAIEEARAKEDFALQQQRARAERDQRIIEAQQSLQDLIDKNARERQRRLEDHNLELADLNAKIAAEQAVTTAANQKEVNDKITHNNTLNTITRAGMGAVAAAYQGGLNGLVSYTSQLLGMAIGQVQNTLNSFAAQSSFAARQQGVEPPRRASGGPVNAGRMYQVADPEAELLKINGKTYLLPSKNGMVEPPTVLQGGARMAGAGAGAMNLTINLGGISVNGTSGDPNLIVAAIEEKLLTNLSKEVKYMMENRGR